MSATKRNCEHALPFAMDPVVYDFAINERGTFADLLAGRISPDAASVLHVDGPSAAAAGPACAFSVAAGRVGLNLAQPAGRGLNSAEWFRRCLISCCRRGKSGSSSANELTELLQQNGFDPIQHEQIRAELKEGRIGLAQIGSRRAPVSKMSLKMTS